MLLMRIRIHTYWLLRLDTDPYWLYKQDQKPDACWDLHESGTPTQFRIRIRKKNVLLKSCQWGSGSILTSKDGSGFALTLKVGSGSLLRPTRKWNTAWKHLTLGVIGRVLDCSLSRFITWVVNSLQDWSYFSSSWYDRTTITSFVSLGMQPRFQKFSLFLNPRFGSGSASKWPLCIRIHVRDTDSGASS